MDARDMAVWPNGLKKTKQRLGIFEALAEAGKPLSARELLGILEQRGSPMWFSTIYRALDSLMEHGAVQKAAVHESGMALYELCGTHRHYAVCMGCMRVVPIHGCPLDGFIPELQDKGFHVLGHKLQISGYCGECHSKQGR